MIVRLLLIGLFFFMIPPKTPKIRFHQLEFTTSDPKITRRCISYDTIVKLNKGFVKETYDDLGRCMKLELFEKVKTYYETADFPSTIKYIWTDTSFIQTLHHSDGQLFSKDFMIRPNKTEYILKDSKVIRIKDYFNDKLIDKNDCDYTKMEEADFFMMYSGCEIKYNSNYRVKF
jgi:hypothetical protein